MQEKTEYASDTTPVSDAAAETPTTKASETPIEVRKLPVLRKKPAEPPAPSTKSKTQILTLNVKEIFSDSAPGNHVNSLPDSDPAAPGKADASQSKRDEAERNQKRLETLEVTITEARQAERGFFPKIAAAFFEIQESKLYPDSYASFQAYCAGKWGYSRAHGNRLAGAGKFISRQKVSPHGDTVKKLTGESHFRPLLSKLDEAAQDAVIDLLGKWAEWDAHKEISPRMVEAAKHVLNPPEGPKGDGTKESPLVKKFVSVVNDAKKGLPKTAGKEIRKIFDQIKKKAEALGDPTRTTGIDWTDKTWNPLQGCARASAGCDHCYAAKLVATRLASVYPGLATEVKKDKKKTYFFNNLITLLPEQLGDPLRDRTPRRYFVNSMSDLFHAKVPDDFIEAVFGVMIKAHWHQFQVLTKRAKRMAEFTARYFKDKTPPENIWLGVSAEDQKALDERLPYLLEVVASIRWLSCEPLIGPIAFDSLDGIDWVVVGGESGSKRKMEAVWAMDIRDACKKADVPYFFKQWGEFGEDGKKLKKKPKKDGLTPPALEGVIHNAYPAPRITPTTSKEAAGESEESEPPGTLAPTPPPAPAPDPAMPGPPEEGEQPGDESIAAVAEEDSPSQ